MPMTRTKFDLSTFLGSIVKLFIEPGLDDPIPGFIGLLNSGQKTDLFNYSPPAEKPENGFIELTGHVRSYGWITLEGDFDLSGKPGLEVIQSAVLLMGVMLDAGYKPLDESNDPAGVPVPFSETNLRNSLVLEGTRDGAWDWDLRNKKANFSHSWAEMLGYLPGEVDSNPNEWFSRVNKDDLPRLLADIAMYLEGQNSIFENEHRLQRKDGSYVWVLARGSAVKGSHEPAVRLIGTIINIDRYKKAEMKLQTEVMYDPLTNLHNRRFFTTRLQKTIERERRHHDIRAAVILISMDRFQSIRDSYGHLDIDRLLIEFSKRLRVTIRPEDTLARFEDDVFAILIEHIKGVNDAVRLASRIHIDLQIPLKVNNQDFFTTASIGIAQTTGYERASDILQDADSARFQAKDSGRGKFRIFDNDLHHRSLEKFRVEKELREGLEAGELTLYYQPIFSAKGQKVVALEALLRWEKRDGRMLLPDEFLDIAEETGLIQSIGDISIRKACSDLKKWYESGFPNIQVAINISRSQLENNNLLDAIDRALVEDGIRAELLRLEIADCSSSQISQNCLTQMKKLHEHGIRLALDHFGAGDTSLTGIKHLPVDTIKLDTVFVRDMLESEEDKSYISALVSLGHTLNMKVGGVGVETFDQIQHLVKQEIDEIQGYFFAQPMPEEDVLIFLQNYKKKPKFLK